MYIFGERERERERETQHTGFFESQLQRREDYYADWIDLIPLSTAKRAKNGCSVSVCVRERERERSDLLRR